MVREIGKMRILECALADGLIAFRWWGGGVDWRLLRQARGPRSPDLVAFRQSLSRIPIVVICEL
jgi:hypothetical protein